MNEKKLKVLILDDEEGIVDFMGRILQVRGFEICQACNGEAAVRIFEEQRPDICVLDVHLKDSVIDGVETLARIKAIDSNAICIMVTRITDQATVDRSRALGVTEYLFKPIDTKELLGVIARVAETVQKKV